MIWPVELGVGIGEIVPRVAAAEGLVGPAFRRTQFPTGTLLKSTITSARSAKPISGRREPAFVADLPHMSERARRCQSTEVAPSSLRSRFPMSSAMMAVWES
jgi:hypothetical protein